MTKIVPQFYPALCEVCCIEKGRKDLTTPKARVELVKYSKKMESQITEETVKEFQMSWNEKFSWYECNKKHKTVAEKPISAPQDQRLFWSTCSKCGKNNLTTSEQEFAHQKIKVDRVLVENEKGKNLKSVKTFVGWEANKKAEKIKCKHCDNEGLKTAQGVF